MNQHNQARNSVRALAGVLLLNLFAIPCVAQKRKQITFCKPVTFAAFKTLPKLEYECPEGLSGSDDKILKLPQRAAAIREAVKELEGLTNAAWWQAEVDDLNACEIHKSAGQLTDEEKEGWKRGDYHLSLLGNHDMRLVLLDDPCYQTGYNGANALFLYRNNGRVFVTQVLNGYYSRVDNSVGIDFAILNGQQLVEVSTGNSMPPSHLYHYFVIDSQTKRAIPRTLFKVGSKLTNEIYSAMLFSEPQALGLPRNAGELKIISGNRLALSFSAYQEDARGKIDDNGRKLARIVYRWNGRFYARAR